jgi:adenine-specific DNA-methyltransferase
MKRNAEKDTNCRFICVQLPEVCDEKGTAYKAGYRTICEIGKERIRRAGAKIKAEQSDQIQLGDAEKSMLDIGFRVFKLDSSNMKIWDDSPTTSVEVFEQRLLDYLDVLVPGRSDTDLVYEIMLKMGQDLCEPICAIDLGGGRQIYGVGADVKFIVCTAANITPEDAALMADYAPGRIIFAEQCFTSTEQKSNVRLALKDRGITIKTL